MKLIIGLGNPGRVYSGHRHNTGFACLNYFARRHGIRFDKKQGLARVGSGRVAGSQVIVARPQTYMNLSGQSAVRLAHKLKVSPADIIVIHDDLDLPLGSIRIRQGGGDGGHKGVKSIIDDLGSSDFIRLRIGIGRPPNTADGSQPDISHYVLSAFTPDEEKTIKETVATAGAAIDCLLEEGLEKAMGRYNQSVANPEVGGI